MKTPEQPPIKAVELVRRIRDGHAERLAGKTLEERLTFYHEEGCKAQAELERLSRQRRGAQQTAV